MHRFQSLLGVSSAESLNSFHSKILISKVLFCSVNLRLICNFIHCHLYRLQTISHILYTRLFLSLYLYSLDFIPFHPPILFLSIFFPSLHFSFSSLLVLPHLKVIPPGASASSINWETYFIILYPV